MWHRSLFRRYTNHSGSLGELKGPAPSATATGPAATPVNESINVDDSNGMTWAFSASGSFSYTETFTEAGVFNNTATIRQTGQSDTATVTVNTYAPAVAVTSGTSWDRDWTWSIDKSVTPTTLTLAPGQTYPVDWTVTVAPTSADSGHQVAGTITVSNPAPIAANLTSVVAAYGELGVSVTCPSLQVAANSSLDCTYSVDVSGPVNGTLVATATLQNYSYTFDGVATATGTTSFQGSADVAFSDLPSVETDECVTVMDTMAGELGYVCQGDQPRRSATRRMWAPTLHRVPTPSGTWPPSSPTTPKPPGRTWPR